MADAAKGLMAATALLLAGCSVGPRPTWFYKTSAESALPGPIALWAQPASEADGGFACAADGGLVFWLGSDEAVGGGQPVQFSAGQARAAIAGRFIADGLGSTEFAIARNAPLQDALATGARRLSWRLPDGTRGSLPLGDEVARLARECPAQSSR